MRRLLVTVLLAAFAGHVSAQSPYYLDRPVIDRTGLDGEYDFTFEFKPDPGAPWLKAAAVSAGRLPLMAGFDVSRLAAGLDRLGFNLESTTAPFDVLVIEPRSSPN
jgi:uncharacterized protein (TIGR03435 family)